VHELERQLKSLGKQIEVKIYPGADHAFFNDTGPRYNATAAAEAYERVLAWFGEYLG
jgi:carboxymethylenebutenolidase